MFTSGFVYLLHFSKPISPKHTTQHYIGWASDLATRIQSHRLGHGARLTAVAHERGIPFKVARVWLGGRGLERQLKNRKNGPRLCPLCGAALPTPFEELSKQAIQEELIPF